MRSGDKCSEMVQESLSLSLCVLPWSVGWRVSPYIVPCCAWIEDEIGRVIHPHRQWHSLCRYDWSTHSDLVESIPLFFSSRLTTRRRRRSGACQSYQHRQDEQLVWRLVDRCVEQWHNHRRWDFECQYLPELDEYWQTWSLSESIDDWSPVKRERDNRWTLISFDGGDELGVETTSIVERSLVISIGVPMTDEEKFLLKKIQDDQSNDLSHVHARDHLLETRTDQTVH